MTKGAPVKPQGMETSQNHDGNMAFVGFMYSFEECYSLIIAPQICYLFYLFSEAEASMHIFSVSWLTSL